MDEATSVISSENWRVINYTFIDFIALTRPHETLRSLVRFTRLLVNSKTLWMATLHPTVERQRDCGCCVKQCSPMLLEIQWPGLNQQSQDMRYASAEIKGSCFEPRVGPSDVVKSSKVANLNGRKVWSITSK